jgi:hypothetical protein
VFSNVDTSSYFSTIYELGREGFEVAEVEGLFFTTSLKETQFFIIDTPMPIAPPCKHKTKMRVESLKMI